MPLHGHRGAPDRLRTGRGLPGRHSTTGLGGVVPLRTMSNDTDAGDNARDGREEASSDNSSDSDLDYWERQLQAALESMEPETRTTQRHNAEDVVVVIVGDSGREERAELTHALERRGFEIVSTTTEEYVRVDATADRLEHPFADPDVRTDGGQLRRCAAKGCTEPMDHLIHGVVLDGTTFEVPTCGGHEDLSNDSPEVRADGGRGSVTDKWHRRCPNGHELHIHADECPRCGSEETAGRALPDGGRETSRYETTDAEYRVGDVVVDLARGKALQVVSESAQRAGEHPETRSDRTADLFDVDPEEPVYNCVFLPDGDGSISPPTKTYAYPQSRLLRFPVEEATDNSSIHHHMRVATLIELAESADDRSRGSVFYSIVKDAYGGEAARTVADHYEGDYSEPETRTDGGGVTELNGVALTGLDAAEEALIYLTDDYNRGELHRGDDGESLVVISRGRSFQHFDLFRKARRLSVSNPRAVDVGEEESDIRLKVELREKASAGVGVTEVGP